MTRTDQEKLSELLHEVGRLTYENGIMREALSFYAEPETWLMRDKDTVYESGPHCDQELIRNYIHPGCDWIGSVNVGGKRAREALARVKE